MVWYVIYSRPYCWSTKRRRAPLSPVVVLHSPKCVHRSLESIRRDPSFTKTRAMHHN